MECPKCGAAQADGGEDCTVCGVIFERWRAMQERAVLLEQMPSQPAVMPERTIPLWMAVAGLVMVVLLGSMWTIRNRAARAKDAPSEDVLNEINNEVVKAQLAADAAQARAAKRNPIGTATVAPSPLTAAAMITWPEGLTEDAAKQMIGFCREFTAPNDLATPKVFPRASKSAVMQQFPWLARAVQMRYVELDEETHRDLGLIEAKIVPTAWSKVPFVDNGTHFELRLGRPQVTKISGVQATADGAQVWFKWGFDGAKGVDLVLTPSAYHGRAVFKKTGRVWTIEQAWIGSGREEKKICS